MTEAPVTQSPVKASQSAEAPDFDLTKLRERYALERARRLRADTNDQCRQMNGAFEHFDHDPYVGPGFARPPIQEEVDVLIVGGGLSYDCI
jgi:hypothetical protein